MKFQTRDSWIVSSYLAHRTPAQLLSLAVRSPSRMVLPARFLLSWMFVMLLWRQTDPHWLSLSRQELSLNFFLMTFKALKFGEPGCLADLLNLPNVHVGIGLRTSDDSFWMEVLRATSERCSSERAFSYIAPRLLNRIPASLKKLDYIATFKSELKTFMFARAFDFSDRSVNEGYRL